MILEEGHRSGLSIHPGANKMYQDLKKNFWWLSLPGFSSKYKRESGAETESPTMCIYPNRGKGNAA